MQNYVDLNNEFNYNKNGIFLTEFRTVKATRKMKEI